MPLTRTRPSAATLRAFRDGLAELVQIGRAPHDLVPEGYAYEIFVLTLRQIAGGATLNNAKAVAWELLLESDSGPLVAGIGHPRGGRRPRLTSLARGPEILKLVEASAQVERLPEVKARDYELRRLFIAGLSIRAFWLKAAHGHPDLLVSQHAVVETFERMKPYPAREFLQVARRLATKRLKFDDRPQPRNS